MADYRTREQFLELFYHLNGAKIAACLRRRKNGYLEDHLNVGFSRSTGIFSGVEGSADLQHGKSGAGLG